MSSGTCPKFNTAQHARKKIAGNVPRLSLEAMEFRVSPSSIILKALRQFFVGHVLAL